MCERLQTKDGFGHQMISNSNGMYFSSNKRSLVVKRNDENSNSLNYGFGSGGSILGKRTFGELNKNSIWENESGCNFFNAPGVKRMKFCR